MDDGETTIQASPPAVQSCDIAVLGGGPAGCVAARGLATAGYRVVLINRPRRFAAVEGISERALAGLRFAGFDRTLAVVGEQVPRVAHWNGEVRAVNHEWLVDRPHFDCALLADAADGGVTILNGTAGACRREGGRWSIHWRDSERRGSRTLAADFVVDARGRGSRRGRGWISGPATCALARRYQPGSGAAPGTAVHTSRDGWFWFADDGAALAVAQWFVSVAERPLPPRRHIEATFDRALAALGARDATYGADRVSTRVEVRDATMALRREPVETHRAFVGDAALAVDPLAGHGIYAAISSALALVPTLHTLLSMPARQTLAAGYYRERQRSSFLRLARSGRDFYRLETRFTGAPFWQRRAAWPDDVPSHEPPRAGVARIARRAVSADGIIVEREVVVTPDHPRGVWQLAGVPLVALMRAVGAGSETGDSPVHAFANRLDVAPVAVESALRWLIWRGLLATPDAGNRS